MRLNGLLLVTTFFLAGLCAQTTGGGTLTGKVMAADGASVPSASVVVTDGSGKARSAVSGPDGIFHVTSLPQGTYRVDIAVPGYKKLSQSNVQVTDGSPLNIQFGLEKSKSRRFFHKAK
jgi:hypothetical protein